MRLPFNVSTYIWFTRNGYEKAMAPAGIHLHKRWLDRDPTLDFGPDELYYIYEYDSEGGSGFGEE